MYALVSGFGLLLSFVICWRVQILFSLLRLKQVTTFFYPYNSFIGRYQLWPFSFCWYKTMIYSWCLYMHFGCEYVRSMVYRIRFRNKTNILSKNPARILDLERLDEGKPYRPMR